MTYANTSTNVGWSVQFVKRWCQMLKRYPGIELSKAAHQARNLSFAMLVCTCYVECLNCYIVMGCWPFENHNSRQMLLNSDSISRLDFELANQLSNRSGSIDPDEELSPNKHSDRSKPDRPSVTRTINSRWSSTIGHKL